MAEQGQGILAAGSLRAWAAAMAAALLTAGTAAAQDARAAPAVFPRPMPVPTLNFYGAPGAIDMPSGEMQPDGMFSVGLSYFGGNGRYTLTFQGLPWLSASFRYNSIENANIGGYSTYFDRGFDLRFRLLTETRRRPAVVLGLQDFVGTGIYAGEYIAATKTLAVPGLGSAARPGTLRLTGGLGWGRLGSYGSIGSPIGNRPAYNPNSTGGQVAYDQWFRGPVAPFAALEWRPTDRLGVKVEYSSDRYVTETVTSNVFERRSPFNFGVEYQATPGIRVGGYVLYGSQVGVNLAFTADPRRPPQKMVIPAPQPVAQRPP
ncbi:MAG: YjbH domain-containing protein, partial [Rhodovulum sp.]